MDKLPDEIIYLLFDLIENTKYLGYFIQMNKRFNKLLQQSFKKYYIEKLLNTDYLLFYQYLSQNEYKTKYIDYLFIKSIKKTNTVWSNFQNGFTDMRFIFELMFNFNCVLNEKMVQNNDLHNNHFYNDFYIDILNCIIYDDRKKTIDNINKIPKLKSLNKNFIFYRKGDYQYKNYLPLIN